MTPVPMRFAIGDRVRTTIAPWISHGHRTALAGKVVLDVTGDCAMVAITSPDDWAGREIEFSIDLLEHLD